VTSRRRISQPVAARVPPRIPWAIGLCALDPRDRLLEVGCGRGIALDLAAAVCEVVGIDRSPKAIASARARHAEAIARGRVRLEALSLEDAADRFAGAFTCVLAVNVNAFWTAPGASFAAAGALLRPRGRLCVAYEPPGAPRADDLAARLPALASAAGLAVAGVERESVDGRALVALCAIRAAGGTRSGTNGRRRT
jgi:SAM-dependent methyltransferase